MYLELSRSGADVFGRALTCLYRVNEYATVLPKNDGLLISSANISRSAFASFLFTRDFFSKCKHTTVNERPENKSAYQLSLVMLLAALRSRSYIHDAISLCTIELSNNTHPNEIVVTVAFECGVSKKFLISYKRGDPIKAGYNTEELRNTWEISSAVCRTWLRNFHQRLEEVSMFARKDNFVLKSFHESDGDDSATSVATRNLATELQVGISNFDRYTIKAESEVTVSLRHLKNVFYFAESLKGNIRAHFDKHGSPIIFKIDIHPGLSCAEFALASLQICTDTEDQHQSQPVIEDNESIQKFLFSSAEQSTHPRNDKNHTIEELGDLCDTSRVYSTTQSEQTLSCSNSDCNEEVPPSPDPGDASQRSQSLPLNINSIFYNPRNNNGSLNNSPPERSLSIQDDGSITDHQMPKTPPLPSKRRKVSSSRKK